MSRGLNRGETKFIRKKDLTYRQFTKGNKVTLQLVIPEDFREKVLRLAHETLMSGHLGIKRTLVRVVSEFFWPGVCGDVARFCKYCVICQRTIQKGHVTEVPLGIMPLIDTPFKRVAVDIVGAIKPHSDKKSRYILTMIDYATRYPEAIALPSIQTERLSPFSHHFLLSPTPDLLSPTIFSFLPPLSPFFHLLSPFSHPLSPFSYLISPPLPTLISLLPTLISFLPPPISLLPPPSSFLLPHFSPLPTIISLLPILISFLPPPISFLPPPISFLPPPFSPVSQPLFLFSHLLTRS